MEQTHYTIEDFLNVRNSESPSISSNGEWLAYISNEDTDTPQVWVCRRDGSEGRRLTDYPDGVGVSWTHHDDDLLIMSKDTNGDENNQLYMLRLSTDKVTAITDNPSVKHMSGGLSRDGRWLAYASNERNGADFDVVLHDMQTHSSRTVFDLGGYCTGRGFSPSGRYMIASKASTNLDNNLYLIDLHGDGEAIHMTPHQDTATYSFTQWLPDESGVFLVSDQDSDISGVWFYAIGSSELTRVLQGQWGVDEIRLTREGDQLLVSYNEDGYTRTICYEVKGCKLGAELKLDLPDGELSDFVWSHDGKYLAFSACTHNSSYNVWLWETATNQARQLTASTMGVPGEIMVKPTLERFNSFDDVAIPFFLYRPKFSKAPLAAIVNIHGGPEGQFRPGFASLIQYYVYHGYAVIAPNVRGSSGYGKHYLSLDDRYKRLDSVRDLESLHQWAQDQAFLDSKRMALMGGSYGGYMVLAGLAFQPQLWAAGVDIVGIANLETFLENTSAYRRGLREAEYGYLATDREFMRTASPIHKADQMRAPLMIIHGSNDPRVPLSEAEQIQTKLAERGVTVKLLVYPDEGHGLSKRKNRLDAYPQVIDFLDQALKH